MTVPFDAPCPGCGTEARWYATANGTGAHPPVIDCDPCDNPPETVQTRVGRLRLFLNPRSAGWEAPPRALL